MIMIVDLSFAVSRPSSTLSAVFLSMSELDANIAPATAAPRKQRMTSTQGQMRRFFFGRSRRDGMRFVANVIPSYLYVFKSDRFYLIIDSRRTLRNIPQMFFIFPRGDASSAQKTAVIHRVMHTLVDSRRIVCG